MDLGILKKMVAEDPVMWGQCVIISLDFSEPPSVTKTHICQVLGEDNMECLEFMGDKLILITVRDSSTRDCILATFCDFPLLTGMAPVPSGRTLVAPSAKMNPSRVAPLSYRLHPVAPVSARVKVIVSGIPYLLINTDTSLLAKQVSKVFPLLSSIQIETLQWRGVPAIGGLLLSAVTSDLMATREELSSEGKNINVGGYFVRLVLQSAAPVTKTISLPERQDSDNVHILW